MDFNEMNVYYRKLISEENIGSRQAGWRDDIAQKRRFSQFFHLLNGQTAIEIGDLGCGLAALYPFLSYKFENLKYTGYDLSADMIATAKKSHMSSNCVLKLISTVEQIMTHDFVVASGIFNIKGDMKNKDWQDYIINQLELINRKSTKGFGFNMLTSYSDLELMKNNLYYADPSFYFDYCKKNFSKNVALLHDYDEYDFTILVRK